jgi:dipeptidyl aminopeptidase/acylaminoacyl peptidase
MRHALGWIIGIIALCLLASAIAGEILGGGVLHPARRLLTSAEIEQARVAFSDDQAVMQEFDVRAPDGIVLCGWKVRPKTANGDWIMLLHGQSDNRYGMMPYADFLVRAGYSVVMMDSRASGASGSAMATYGWKERWDTKNVVSALYTAEEPRRLYALGESMGAAIALQSAAVESRISSVVAEASFSNLREVTYDYAGLQLTPWLGKTLFRPATITALRVAEKEGEFRASDVSPETAVAARAFPILLICGTLDRRIPCRHSEQIFRAAKGPKQLWIVPGAGHTAGLGTEPVEFKRRVLAFFAAN